MHSRTAKPRMATTARNDDGALSVPALPRLDAMPTDVMSLIALRMSFDDCAALSLTSTSA